VHTAAIHPTCRLGFPTCQSLSGKGWTPFRGSAVGLPSQVPLRLKCRELARKSTSTAARPSACLESRQPSMSATYTVHLQLPSRESSHPPTPFLHMVNLVCVVITSPPIEAFCVSNPPICQALRLASTVRFREVRDLVVSAKSRCLRHTCKWPDLGTEPHQLRVLEEALVPCCSAQT
jgi:hypothetical protein